MSSRNASEDAPSGWSTASGPKGRILSLAGRALATVVSGQASLLADLTGDDPGGD